jgi:hypothetical protein
VDLGEEGWGQGVFLYTSLMTQTQAKPNRSFAGGCISGLLSILLGLALTASTALVQRRYYPVCGGGLSAGYPIVFLCDGSGGSPIGIPGRIDSADWVNGNPPAFLLDFLLYSALLWLAWTAVMALLRDRPGRDENFKWGLLVSVGCLAVFLFAFLSFQSTSLSIEHTSPRTPTPVTPIVPSPSGLGTPPPLSTSYPTAGP